MNFKVDLGLKFGSDEIVVYKKGAGIVAKEPAYLAVTTNGKAIKVHAIGKKAEKLFLAKNANFEVFCPIKNGEIVDEKMATLLLSKIIENVVEGKAFVGYIHALVALPSSLNEHQILLIKKVLHASGVNKVEFTFNAVCVQNALDIDPNKNFMVVDIGKYSTDFTILNEFSINMGRMYFVGGLDMDKSIQTFIADNFNLKVSEQTAEKIKNELASLYANDMYPFEFVGTDENNNLQHATITANDVRLAITNVYDAIIERVDTVIKTLPAEVVHDIYTNGIVFVGGGCKIAGLYEYVKAKLNYPVFVPAEPADAVIMGLGKLLSAGKDFLKITF